MARDDGDVPVIDAVPGVSEAPPAPAVHFGIGITGHGGSHPQWAANRARIEATLAGILDLIEDVAARTFASFPQGTFAPLRLNCLLADGTDHMAADLAVARGYRLVASMPFGERLNLAINSRPTNAEDTRALLAGEAPADPATRRRAEDINRLARQAQVLTLADHDDRVGELLLAHLETPDDPVALRLYQAEGSRQVAAAGMIVVEQSDLLIAVWDGATTAHPGGTGHTVAAALDTGAPVVWIDPSAPEDWRVLRAPEALATRCQPETVARSELEIVIGAILDAARDIHVGGRALAHERWHSHSTRLAQAYRRIETIFGDGGLRGVVRNLRQDYEAPEQIGSGSARALLEAVGRLPGADADLPARIDRAVLRRFAWADGVSTNLSDHYRGGMTVNFILSSLAIAGGLAYLPLVSPDSKWLFALIELLLLCAILTITFVGRAKGWHRRWLETRRVAEYLRHSPLLLILGTARPLGRWPKGAETSWPEAYAREAIREVGMPHLVITTAYLRAVLSGPLAIHATNQRDYHRAKAARLTRIHHNLDLLSERLFQLAVATVATYLLIDLARAAGWVSAEWVLHASKWFTLFGVVLPTFGSAVAGIRYFGDFERFAAISQVTAAKLDVIAGRIDLLASASDEDLTYCRVASLAHSADEVVFDEVGNWQAVFGGKQITVPV